MKVRSVPCLCRACIADSGQQNCDNYKFTDSWHKVDLVPEKGKNKRKYQKRKDPRNITVAAPVEEQPEDSDAESYIIIEGAPDEIDIDFENQSQVQSNDLFIDLTEGEQEADLTTQDVCCEYLEEEDVIITDNTQNSELHQSHDVLADIPEQIYWESMLASIERCTTFNEMLEVATNLLETLRPLRERKMDVHFNSTTDSIDKIALALIPDDVPGDLVPIWTTGDGNCLGHALSKGFSGTDEMHVEIRARILLNGILNKDEYISARCLNRGAALIRDTESLPAIYTKYSDFYVSGQKLTEDTIEYMYCRELHECSHLHTYMGLWQLAQAATALDTPIQSIYPEGGDHLMRLDFNRMFFPINYKPESHVKPIRIMWTSIKKGCPPSHFVPLLSKNNKYDIQIIT